MATEKTAGKSTAADSYTTLKPQCPICRSTARSETSEDIPDGFDRHFVRTKCADCGTRYTVEYRPIDVSWTNPGHEQHSAASQGRLTPDEREYAAPEQFPPLPDEDLLAAVEWPVSCECGEDLTGNHIVTGAGEDSDVDAVETLILRCPACLAETIKSATDSE